VSIKAYLYDADGHDREATLNEQLITELNGRRLLWVDVAGREPKEIESLASLLRFHPASVKAVANQLGRPRLYNYGHYFQFGLTALNPNQNETHAAAAVEFLCGPGYVVTIHDDEVFFLLEFRKQDRGETQIGALLASVVVAAMLDLHLSTCFRLLENLELEVDRVEEEMLTRAVDRGYLARLVELRHRVSQLRRLLFPQREIFCGLTRPDCALVAETEAAPHFQALNNRYERAIDAIEHAHDLVLGSFELFASRTAESTNNFLKGLTFITLLLGVTGVVAGIFGMNFEVDLWKTGGLGFWGVIAGMALVVVSTILYSRNKGWI
jgi:magnesium/cobalt transport protein CorA